VIHEVKCWPQFFTPTALGVEDRGDLVRLRHRHAGRIPGCPVDEARQFVLVKQVSVIP